MEGEFTGPVQFRAYIDRKINEYQNARLSPTWYDHDTVMHLAGKSTRGLPVRPKIVERLKNGEKVYAFNLKQCRKLVKAIDEATT